MYRLIPKFARLVAGPPSTKLQHPSLQCALFSSSSGGGGEDGPGSNADAGGESDFLSQYLQGGGASSDGPFRDQYSQQQPGQSNRSFGQRQPPSGRFGGRGGRGGGRTGPRGYGPRSSQFNDGPVEPLSEEDLKLKQELDAKRMQTQVQEKKAAGPEEEEEEETQEGEPRSMYTGFIDPMHDDILKDHKQQMKRMKYKQQVYVPKRQRRQRDDNEGLDDLDKDSDDEEGDGRRGRSGAMSLEALNGEASDSDFEVDEEEWEVMHSLDSKEFERHLKHREHAKLMMKEYDARIAALDDDKASDEAEVEKVQEHIMKKWRAHYRIPRLITPLEKEEMYKKHKEDPKVWTVEKLAEEYNCYRARVHAILWLWEMRTFENQPKSAEEETKEYLDSLAFDEFGKPCLPPHMGEDKWVTPWYTKPNYKIMPEDWEGSVRTEEEAIEEASAKEEAMMLDEFVKRMEFNKLQIAGLIKAQKHLRRRPAEGWSYVVEKLGPEGKRGKRGGYRFVASADGKHRKLNELEKLMLRREAVRPRRRIL